MWKAVSLGLALAVLLSVRDARAFELKHTPSGQLVQWREAQVAFVVDPSVEAAVPGGAAAIVSAVAAWSGVSGAPELVASVGPGGGKVAVDGQNTILLAPDGYEPAGGALAVTVLSFDDTTGAIVDADIVVNGIHAFAVLAAQAKAAQASPVSNEGAGSSTPGLVFDLQHVAAHEVGHSLGLGDVDADDALMYAYTLPGDASSRAPLGDDTEGLASLYSSSAISSGCGQASAAGERHRPGSSLETLAGVMAAALGLACRRRKASRTSQPRR